MVCAELSCYASMDARFNAAGLYEAQRVIQI